MVQTLGSLWSNTCTRIKKEVILIKTGLKPRFERTDNFFGFYRPQVIVSGLPFATISRQVLSG